MDPVAAVVLGACALFIGFTLLAMFGRPHRSRLFAAWVAMVGFAFLASFIFWKRYQLRMSADPVYYDLQTTPGPHKLVLAKPGLSPGYRIRLVRRADRTFDPDLFAKLGSCQWGITSCEKLALSHHTFEQDGVIECDSEYPDVVLQYEAAPETRKFLEEAAVQVGCPSGFHKSMAQGLQMLNSRLTFFLAGLVLAGFGASVQRRKLRIRPPAGTPPSPPA
jgi:hypothetical protein